MSGKVKMLIVALCLAALPFFAVSAAAQTKRPKQSKQTVQNKGNNAKTVQDSDAPPLEEYTCYQIHAVSLAYSYSGYIILKPGNKYIWGFAANKSDGKLGKYSFDSKGVHFINGKLADVNAIFETRENGRHLIELHIVGEKQYASDDGITKVYCNCYKHDPDAYKK